MAIYVAGVPCGLCGLPVDPGDEKVLFPPFVPNRRDPLHVFSDGVFHQRCVAEHSLGERATRAAATAALGDPRVQTCVVCGKSFTGPDDYFATGYLGADVDEFNFICVHPSHFDRWERAAEFREVVLRLQQGDAWDGPRIVFEPLLGWIRQRDR